MSHFSTSSFDSTLIHEDKSPSISSLVSDTTQVAVEDYLFETKEQNKEDYKMIKEEKAETGRVLTFAYIVGQTTVITNTRVKLTERVYICVERFLSTNQIDTTYRVA